jgi:hypothetical protein
MMPNKQYYEGKSRTIVVDFAGEQTAVVTLNARLLFITF